MRRILLLWFCLLWGGLIALKAQDKVRISGNVLSLVGNKGIANAWVLVQAGDSTLTRCVTNSAGYFECLSPRGVDRLFIRYMDRARHVMSSKPIDTVWDIGICYLDVPTRVLDEVRVKGVRPFVDYDAGRAIYDLKALPASARTNVLELIGRIPTVQFRSGEGFVLNGFGERLEVFVDKRPLRMSARALEVYLSAFPLEDVASVQIIDNPSPEFPSEGRAVLNIITQKSLDEGYSLYTQLKGQYQHHFSGLVGTRLSINKGISRSYLSYGYTQERHRESTELLGRTKTVTDVLPNHRHQLDMGTTLRLNAEHTLSLNARATLLSEDYLYNSQPLSRLTRPHVLGAVHHDYQRGKWSVFSLAEGAWAAIEQKIERITPHHIQDNTHFVRLMSGPKYQLTPALRLSAVLGYEGSAYRNRLLEDNTSFDYKQNEYLAYIALQYRKSKWYAYLGLDYVVYNRSWRRDGERFFEMTSALLPKFTVNYQPAPKHQLAWELVSNYKFPSYRDITPIRTVATGDWLREGNTALRLSRVYTTTLRYNLVRKAQLELKYSYTQDPMVEEPVLAAPNQIVLRKTNLDNSQYLRGLLTLPIPILRTESVNWLATTTVGVQSQWDRGQISAKGYNQHFTTYQVSHKQDVKLSDSWTFALSGYLYGPLYYGLYKMETTWWLEASVAKSFGSWRVSLQLIDPWNSNVERGSYNGLSMPLSFVRDYHRPQLSLSLSYGFGNAKMKKYQAPKIRDISNRMRLFSDEGIASGSGRK